MARSLRAQLTVIFLVVLARPESARPAEGDNLDYLSALEREVVLEINLARSSPDLYVSFLEEWQSYYRGRRIERSGKPAIVTEEGVVAVEEATRFLRSMGSLPLLRPSLGMSQGSKDHVNELGPVGAVGHKGIRGSWPTDRVNRYGRWRQTIGESIYYGRSKAREIVIWLIVDDGVPSRAHRRNIFDPAFHFIGVGCGAHATYGTMCVLTFAGEYVDRAQRQ
ncbi:MAG: CAP domain-containing protein [Acidiferrobacterales bacterium]